MNGESLEDTILSEPLISRVFSAGQGCFLVGGYVRDILRGAASKDMDFVVKGDVKRIAEKILSKIGGSLVEFKKAGMVRLVAADATLDFSRLEGRIEDDLCRRDFTMNAIAWSVHRGITDPFGGLADIKKGIIRAISEDNLMDDPLRLLRAYRFSGELGWTISRETRAAIRRLKGLMRLPASERITSELFMLLGSDNYLKALRLAREDGVLEKILSINNNKLQDNLKELSRLDLFLKNLPEGYVATLDKPFSQGLSYLGLFRLEQLLTGSALGKNRLALSRAVIKRLEVTARLKGRHEKKKLMDRNMMFNVFTRAGDAVMDTAVLFRSRRWLKEAGLLVGLKPLLRAEDIIMITHAHGPKIGKLTNEMRRLQFIGKLRSEEDARAWLEASRK